MYGRHSFNLQPLPHNHQSYWRVLTTPRLSIIVGIHAGENSRLCLHVDGSAVQRTGIGYQLIFGSCRGQSRLGIVRSL